MNKNRNTLSGLCIVLNILTAFILMISLLPNGVMAQNYQPRSSSPVISQDESFELSPAFDRESKSQLELDQ
jgi:hypothetical protein